MVLALAKETGKARSECKAVLSACNMDYSAARDRLVPLVAVDNMAPRGQRIEGIYEPAEAFEGGRPGWMFKSGVHGMGYYREIEDAASEVRTG